MHKNNEKILSVAMLLFAISVVAGTIISDRIGFWLIAVLKLAAIIFLIIFRARIGNWKIESKFLLLMIMTVIPFFWNNAYLEDSRIVEVTNYLLAILFSVLLSGLGTYRAVEKYIMVYYIFSIITAIFTVVSMVWPDLYLGIARMLFSPVHFEIIRGNLAGGNLFGLTNHYSRNAFYLVIGLYYTIFTFKESRRKTLKIALIVFYLILFLAIGKRAQPLYGIAALAMTYIFFDKLKFMTTVKILGAIVSVICVLGVVIVNMPQANRTLDRLINNKQDDYSSGRIDMYAEIEEQYENNNYIPIGWGRYAKSTNYYHPALHCDYLQLYYEVGLLGALLVLVPNIVLLVAFVKRNRRGEGNYIVKLAIAYSVFFIIFAITGLPRYENEMYALYFIINSLALEKGVMTK